MFDPESLQWKQLPETHFARSNPVLTPYRGKLYVFGGEGNSYGQVIPYYFFHLGRSSFFLVVGRGGGTFI